MSIPINANQDFQGTARLLNLPDGATAQEPATVAQLNSAVEGLAWKDSVRVAASSNINLASPGATIDGVTMVAADRFLARSQTAASENGIYIWNGAATPATRSLDMNTAAEVEQAVTTVEEGTSAGASFRQTAVNVTLGTTSLAWTAFGTSAPASTDTTQGIIEIATQAETDAGTDYTRAVTPLTLATYANRKLKYTSNVGDGSATSYVITHNLGTLDVQVYVYETGGSKRMVLCEVQHTSTTSVTLLFASAPAAGALRVVVLG